MGDSGPVAATVGLMRPRDFVVIWLAFSQQASSYKRGLLALGTLATGRDRPILLKKSTWTDCPCIEC